MFFSKIKDGEDPAKYDKITVDGRVFFYLKPIESNLKTSKRRYSDQFKDSLFLAKDTNKKLKMIKQFNLKYKDMIQKTEKYISCIEEAIWILKKEFQIEPSVIFQGFDLKSLGFNPEDYGVIEEENGDYDE
jgi:hypothetical protein